MTQFSIQKSFVQKKEAVTRDWYLVDAANETLGRMATRLATILMGKNKPTYTPHVDCGDFVVVINAQKVVLTGNKREKKNYYYHTGFMGGLKSNSMEWMLEHKPEEVIRLAVRRMLPKNKLGRQMLRKLKVYGGADHDNHAQQPKTIEFNTVR